jgi:CubicO group peptidase (beta-lactamase class C family)
MKRLQINLIALFFVLFCCIHTSGLKAQTKQSELLIGAHISTVLKPGEKHQYTLKLKDEQFAFIKLVQKGVDIIITSYDADGKKIADFDSPNGKYGPELITIVSGKRGNYMLEVRPFDEKEPQGNYELNIEKIEPKAVTPSKQVDQLFSAWNNQETPGAAVAIVKDGKIILKKGYGSANLEYEIPIVPSTIFHIASVSKQFTVFSILLLAQEGKLSLNDDIRKYIPEVPDFGKVITLRQLAHHTSGLRDQWNLLGLAGWRLDDVITKEHILKLISKQKELNFNPGEEFSYCNTGFTLLAEVVARVSGQPFADFTKEHIFEPLNMSSTLFYDDHEKIVKNRAYSFYTDSKGFKKSVLNYANVGATSLFTTVEDLSLWAMNFETLKLGGKDIIDQMNERGILNNGDTISYALGQDIGKYKGLKLISHGGADAGYRTYLGRFPDQKFSVIILSNDASFNPGGWALKVADIYLKEKLIADNSKVVENSSVLDSNTVLVDSELLKSFSGQFEIQPGIILNITLEDNKLFAESTGLAPIQLNPISSTEFTVPGMNAKVVFLKEDNGDVNKLNITLNGKESFAPRVKPFDAKSVNLSEFTGDFYSPELSTTYYFVFEAGKLVAKHSRLSNFELTPIKSDFFSSDQWFFGQVEFIRDNKNSILGCKVSSGRVRNLWFDKLSTKN